MKKMMKSALALTVMTLVTAVMAILAPEADAAGAVYVAGKLAAFTSYLAERLGHIRFIKAMNSEEQEKTASLRYIEERYEADKHTFGIMAVM